MLDYYEQYFARVGPMKKFRNKKEMFSFIAAKLKETLGADRTGEQCSTRYKTVMKRRKVAVAHNHKSGNSPTPIPFEDEVEKIRLLDDSLEPAELRDSYGVVSKKAKQSTPSTAPSPVSEGGSDSTAASEDTEESSAETAEKAPIKTARQSTVRAQEIKLFFEEMERLQRDKEQQRAAREDQRRQRHEERKAYREELRKEKAARHEQKMQLLKRVLGLPDVDE